MPLKNLKKLPKLKLPESLEPYVDRIRHAGMHVVYQALAVMVPFLLMPVITHYVAPEQYGQYALYMSVISFIGPLLVMGMDLVIVTDYFKYSAEQRQELLSSYMVLLLTGVLIIESVVLTCHGLIESWMGLPFGDLIFLGLVAGLFCLMQVAQLVTMMEKRLAYQGFFILGKVAIAYSVSVALVTLVSPTWDSLVWAQVAAYGVLASAGLWFLIRHGMLKPAFSPKMAKSILVAAGPLVIFATAFNASTLVDRMIIKHFMTLHDVGIYTMAVLILSLGLLFFQAIARVMWPWVSKNMSIDSPVAKLKVVKVTYVFWAFIVLVYLVGAVAGGLAIKILTSKQYVMPEFLPPMLAFSLMFNAILSFGLYFLGQAKRFITISAIAVTVLSVAAGLNILLIPVLGLPGVAIANGTANLVGVIWCLTATFKTIDLPWGQGLVELRREVRMVLIQLGQVLLRGFQRRKNRA